MRTGVSFPLVGRIRGFTSVGGDSALILLAVVAAFLAVEVMAAVIAAVVWALS